MSEASPKFDPRTCADSSSATSSLASESGATASGLPNGPMTDLFGREVAPARPSPARGKAEGLMTLAISGLLGHDSSASASLQRSLENRLMMRLDMAGSTLFKLTWKRRRTPLGRRYLERAALGRRTSGKGCTSLGTVNTPQATDYHGGQAERVFAPEGQRHGRRNNDLALLATVPTPMAGSPATETCNAAGNNDYSRKIVELATVATPKSEDSQCAGAHRGSPDTLHSQTQLATVSSPSARDWKDTPGMSETGVDPDGSERTRLDQLPRQAQLAASGPTATGGTAETASTGQLNPDYSRWLMGLPTVFSSSADTAMRSFRKLRRRSSKRTCKR